MILTTYLESLSTHIRTLGNKQTSIQYHICWPPVVSTHT